MTNPTPKRFRPRFSIRTLVIVVTLVCVYLACWEVTKRTGMHDVVYNEYFGDYAKTYGRTPTIDDVLVTENVLRSSGVMKSPAPFLVSVEEVEATSNFHVQEPTGRRVYYLWLFGYTVEAFRR